MPTKPGSDWTVLMTSYDEVGFPHLDALRESNPLADIHICIDDGEEDRDFKWRNPDWFIREWWKRYRGAVRTSRVALLEYDALVTAPLPDIEVRGVAGAQLKRPGDDWYWWDERRKLGRILRHAVGVVPMGVIFLSAEAMDRLADEEWDYLYRLDLFSEMRLPSIIKACGLPVIQTSLPDVGTIPITPRPEPGIYHPVKIPALRRR